MSGPPTRRQRILGSLVLAGAVAAAVAILLDVDPGDRTSWAKHVAGALGVLFVPGGVAGLFVSERNTVRAVRWAGWSVPVVFVWLGVEHWLNWFAFYNPSHGRGRITTETGARVQGCLVIALGLLAAWIWTLALRARRRPG